MSIRQSGISKCSNPSLLLCAPVSQTGGFKKLEGKREVLFPSRLPLVFT